MLTFVVSQKIGLLAVKGIGEGVKAFVQEDPTGCREVAKLVAYGSRHGTSWLASQPDPGITSIPPCFRWNDLGYMISFIKDLETRVEILRTLCEGYGVAGSSTIIRYWVGQEGDLAGHFEFATTTRPPPWAGPKRYADGSIKPVAQPSTRFIHITGVDQEFLRYRSHKCGEQFAYASTGWVFKGDALTGNMRPAIGPVTTYELIFGDPYLGAVYRAQIREPEGQQAKYKLDPGTLKILLEHTSFDQWDFITGLGKIFGAGRGYQFGRSLFTLAMVSEFYNRYLPSSTVSLTVLTKPLYNSCLFRDTLTNLDPSPQAMLSDEQPGKLFPLMSRAAMFSLVFYFESGGVSMPEKSLQGVMAISCGNSLFVASHLLADPAENIPSYSVQKIPGNIGRPGIALLIPPENPRIRKAELDKWKMIEHAAFDGTRPIGQFEGTSVQLSFTGYELGVDTGQHGLRGRAAFFSETRVSVLSQGAWVADVDLLGGIESRQLHQECADHTHSCGPPKGDMKCISIDNWEEILDPPKGLGIVRATGGWIARLSAVAIFTQMGYLCLVVQGDSPICWDCIKREARDNGKQEDRIILVI